MRIFFAVSFLLIVELETGKEIDSILQRNFVKSFAISCKQKVAGGLGVLDASYHVWNQYTGVSFDASLDGLLQVSLHEIGC